MKQAKRILSVILVAALLISTLAVGMPTVASAAGSFASVGGWNETIYAKISGIKDADVTGVSYTGPMSGSLTGDDLEYLVRDEDGYTRIDILGLTAGTYTLTVNTKSGDISQSGIVVPAQDRSGFAHFGDTEGVGAYTNDGKLKANAIVLYVTDSNKNTVSVTSSDGTTVTGIGNILGSTGMDVGTGLTSKGGKPNTNQDILRKLAKDGTPLVVRLIGNVTAPEGVTAYDSVDYGGSTGDNGYMVRMSGGKNITIEGVGANATMNGWGMHFMCQTADYAAGYGRSFEVRNLAFRNVPEDCVGMEGVQDGSNLTAPVERCWIHNCSFYAPKIANPAESDKGGGDGACDFKRGQYMTMSYCYYEGYHKTNLVGANDDNLQYHITWHHNYWKNCEARGPLGRQANMHIYNCIYEGQTDYAMNPRANCYIFSEYNFFYQCKDPANVKSGAIKSYQDVFAACGGENGATVVTSREEKVSSNNKYANYDTDPALSYIPSGKYSVQESISEMRAEVMANAGAQPETIRSAEDVVASVIKSDRIPTNPVALPYEQNLNKAYLSSTSGVVDNIVFNVKGLNNDSLKLGATEGQDIVFKVNAPVNITMTEISGTNSPQLLNEGGEPVLTGSGTVNNLPAGCYFIQSNTYSGGFKECKIASLKIEAAVVHGPNDHVYTSVVTKPTCTEGGYTTYTCDCGASYIGDETPAAGHKPGDAPTCITNQTCTVCGATVKDALGHTYENGSCVRCSAIDPSACTHGDTVVNGYKDSTCSAAGYTGDTFCNTCKTIVKTGDSIAKKAHTPGAAASCTTAQTCTECGATIKEALGHSFANGSCTVCGAEDLTAKGYIHNFTESELTSSFYKLAGSPSTKSAVTYNGISMTRCLKINSEASIEFTTPENGAGTLTMVFNAKSVGKRLAISDGRIVTIPSDAIVTLDVAAGTKYIITKDNGESNLFYLAYAPAAASHTCTWGEGVVTSAADCTNDGVMTYTCTVSGCGKTKTEAIAATGHKPGAAATCVDPQTCTVCGDVITPATGNHSYVDGKCSVCGAVDSDVCNHTNTSVIGAKEATCKEEGYTGDTYCNDCKTVTETGKVIAKIDHTPGAPASCTTAQTCTACGTTLNPATGHNYVDGTCTSCGQAEPVLSVTAAGHLESAYVEWGFVEGADGYNVYVKSTSASSWTQLDNMLIRQYKDHMRADAVGLKAGTYEMKIVPLANGAEQTAQAITTDTLTVLAHDRSGYAFVSGKSLKGGQTVSTSSGAYNDDGTLKSNAVVVYVTNDNKDTVTATIGGVSCTGIAAILGEVDKAKTPVCIRLIGNITDPAATGNGFASGDLLIDNAGNSIGLTIEGIGEDTTCNGFGIRLKNSSNVEIRNLAVMNVDSTEGDNIGIQQTCDHIWVHNCDLFYGEAGGDSDQAKGDGALDTKKSEYVTHSYNHFWDCGKCCLQGGTKSDTSNYITYHHNWFDHSDSRHPRVRVATVHVYNNYYDGNSKYGIGAAHISEVISEGNYFRNTKNPMLISTKGSDEGINTMGGETPGTLTSYKDYVVGATSWIPNVDGIQGATSWSDTSYDCVIVDTTYNAYSYKLESAEQAKATVEAYAGRVNGGDFQWTFTDADDTDYSVNQEMKAALHAYDDQIVAIGGSSVSVNPGPDPTDPTDPNPTDPNPTDPTDPVNPPVPASSIVHNFTDDGFTSSFFTFAGSHITNGKHGKFTHDFGSGTETLNNALKFDSGGSVTFTPTADGTVTIAVATNTAGRSVVIKNGTSDVGKVTMDNAMELYVLTVDVSANVTYTVKQGDKESGLYYIAYTPNTPAAELFKIPCVAMNLGNSLSMLFYVPVDNVTEGDYAQITKTYADGRPDVTVKVPLAGAQIKPFEGVNCYVAGFDGIAAKEMNDNVSCVVCHADGTPVSEVYDATVKAYAEASLATDDAKLRTLMVDLLNYGAAAQKAFGYDKENPANKDLTEAQKGYATKDIDVNALAHYKYISGVAPSEIALLLKSNIRMMLYYPAADLNPDMVAKIRYTDHHGNDQYTEVKVSDFGTEYAGQLCLIIDTLLAADYKTVVTVEIYNGTELVSSNEVNMVKYCALNPGYDASIPLAKYCQAAYNYFHKS